MPRIGLLALLVLPLASAADSASTPESLQAVSNLSFSQAEARHPSAMAGSRYVRVSGNTRLSGSAYAPARGSRYVSLTVSGWASVRGADGVQSGSFRIHERVGFWVSEHRRHYSAYVRINQHVSLYKDGKYVGSTYVGGTIRVAGWKSGNWIRLNGSGMIDGSILLQEGGVRSAAGGIEGKAVLAKATFCRLSGYERDMCVYSCSDGTTLRRPIREADPWDDMPVIACPQIVIPF